MPVIDEADTMFQISCLGAFGGGDGEDDDDEEDRADERKEDGDEVLGACECGVDVAVLVCEETVDRRDGLDDGPVCVGLVALLVLLMKTNRGRLDGLGGE